MWTTLLLIVPPVIIAILVWNFRRQAAAREAASAERMKAIFGETGVPAKGSSPQPTQLRKVEEAPAAAPAALAAPAAVAAKQQTVTGFTARSQVVDAAKLPVYQWLQTVLPQHTVLPCMSLAAFIQPAENLIGFAREAQIRRLTDATVDFLICSNTLKPLVGVQCGTRNGKAAETAAFAAACVLSTGVRWLEITPEALPSPESVRALVHEA